MAAERTSAFEAALKRNPHPDFKSVEATRPPFPSTPFTYTQTPSPAWTFGTGPNTPSPPSLSHIPIDPHSPLRPSHLNYKLLISAIIPRPIAFLSTTSPSGTTTNLAPFSYFQMLSHDPPLFVISFTGPASPLSSAKDSLRNLLSTKECTINIISSTFLEAANSTSINAPYGASEWDISGLTPVYDCETVKAPRVKESVFSVEGKLESFREFESRANPGKKSGTMVVVEGTRFWAREDAVNEERSMLDPAVLKAVGRLGGITYGRVGEGLELPRPSWEGDLGGAEGYERLERRERPRGGEKGEGEKEEEEEGVEGGNEVEK